MTGRRIDYKGAWLLCRRAFYILAIATASLEEDKPLSDADLAHVRSARDRITATLDYLNE